MSREYLTYWKCPRCHGTGLTFEPWFADEPNVCSKCGGSGNALVDGEAERHKRRLLDFDRGRQL